MTPIISRLWYQVFSPRITTSGLCARGCGTTARGGGSCRECVTRDLARVVGETLAYRLLQQMEAVQLTLFEIEDATAVPEEF